ncbi:Rieske (2Fe-2S) protein [Limimaricola litoreus]|uniref:Rieske 2Fe-2S domain-containing protein n=1 Tax=Limimaricola litoreus TaxID=2955316 RepID=A0A9X2FTT3_9RHOB|nr:Rieske 2Fe-2S domain-containing protein [Limimaricola litoreus]MCP1168306.1 Rieske 2Fe-2S domain-containing protein [Limimaricola litoreus]
MKWSDLRAAPAPGTVILQDAPAEPALSLTVTSEAGDFPLLLVRTAQGVRGYVNMCPHQFLPLDHRGGQLLSKDGAKLMCSAHGAMFDAATGKGVAGEGLGCALLHVPLETHEGEIRIACAMSDG